jgi:hypothetical protein
MKIVLSYRRSDAPGMAGWIYDCLSQHYGDQSVFRDVDSIPFGVDFRKHIRTELDQCNALIAIIGPRWLGEGNHQRIHDQNDFVRFEIETALQRSIPVVPLLVEGATMPRPDQLPETLRDLAFYNAAEVDSGRDFRVHTQRLIESLDRLLIEAGGATGDAHQKAGPERLVRKQATGPRSDQDHTASPRRTGARPRKTTVLDEAKIALVLSASQQSAPIRDQDRAHVATAENQVVPSPATPLPQNKRLLRWTAAGLGLMALLAGGIYLTPEWQEPETEGWREDTFPSPNAGLLAFTITPDGNPACASYDGTSCLWGEPIRNIDFSRVKPLVCGAGHRSLYGTTGFEDPKHWCNLALRAAQTKPVQ